MDLNKIFASIILLLGIISFAAQPSLADSNVNLVKNADGTKDVSASTVVAAPVAVVWKVITDYNSFTSFMPGLKQCSILQNAGSTKKAQIKLDVSSLMKPFNYQADINENSTAKTVTMTRTSGDFNYLKLTYSLKPVESGRKTLVTYNLKIDHGSNIPGFFADKALKNNVSKTLEAVNNKAGQATASSKIASN